MLEESSDDVEEERPLAELMEKLCALVGGGMVGESGWY